MTTSSMTGGNDTDVFLELDIPSCLASGNAQMLLSIDLADLASRSRVPVLITGEKGVGKSLLARYIHESSPKRSRPCLSLRCPDLREGELHARFFGDKTESGRPAGMVGEAAGGTLVLDAVDMLPYPLQKELLKILREHPPGEDGAPEGYGDTRRLAARLISTGATGSRGGSGFLEELMYILGEIMIRVPPLRERREDIDPLAIRALRAANRLHGKRVARISRTARDFILHYEFPGNVRELYLMIERAVRLTTRDTLYVEDLGTDGLREDPHQNSDQTLLALDDMEKRHISRALLRTGWNRTAAARILRISETLLARKIKLYGLERGQ